MEQSKQKIVLATRNAGKIAELRECLASLGVLVLGLADFPQIGELAEDGKTFAENALQKAGEVCFRSGLVALADDSGLEVEALGGAPGIYSARYASLEPQENIPADSRELSADARNIDKVLKNMQGQSNRKARFVCAIAVVAPAGGPERVFQGVWDGALAQLPLGENGFGYDPIFIDKQSGLTAAQMSPEEKRQKSHRGKALEQLALHWPKLF